MIDTVALREKVLDLAIRGKLVPQDPNDEPASVLLERIREQKQQMVKEGKLKAKDIKDDSVIFVGDDNLHYEKFADGTVKCIEDEIPFELPEGWAWCRLKNVISLSSGKSIKVRELTNDAKYSVYGGNGINGTYNDYNVEPNTIVIGRVGFYCGSVYKTEDKAWVTDNALICTVKTPSIFDVNFLVLLLRHFDLGKTAVACAQPVVSGRGILPLVVPVPPINEQVKIQDSYQMALPYIESIEDNSATLKSIISLTKSKILDLAIRGKLVSQDPSDEPASVLLERIRAEKEELIKQGKIKRDKKESIIFKGDDNSYYEKYGEELPQGWVVTNLETLLSYEQPTEYIVESTDYNDAYPTPVLTAGKSFILGYTNETSGIFKRIPTIIFDDFTTESKYVDFEFKVKSSAMKILSPNTDLVLSKFAYYLMQSVQVDHDNHQRYWISVFSKQEVALPPLPEQQRIVDVIDHLYSLLDNAIL